MAHQSTHSPATGPAPNTAGPHKSDLLNKLDPRVDSDLSKSTGSGVGGASRGTHTGGNVPEGTYGPHSSRVANAADPRVDSDRDGSRRTGAGVGAGSAGYGTGTTGHSAGVASEGTYGTHSSRLANAADPRIDSDGDGSRTIGGGRQTNVGNNNTTGGRTIL